MNSDFKKFFEKQSQMAKTLDSMIPKIDTSIFDIAIQSQSLSKIANNRKILEKRIKDINSIIPQIDTSIFNAITQSVSRISSIGKILEKQSQMAKTLDSMIPKIDTSIFDIAIQSQSLSKIANNRKILEKRIKDISSIIPQIDTSVFDIIQTDEIYKSIDVALSEKDIQDIEILNDKIEQKIVLTESDWQFYVMISKELIYLIAAVITIYAYLFPNNTEILHIQQQLHNMKGYQEQKSDITKNIHHKIYYEITKQVYVRALPSSSKESKIIDVAFSKQKLLLISSKSYWIQIEYFNEDKQETIIGWVSKRYTKKLL